MTRPGTGPGRDQPGAPVVVLRPGTPGDVDALAALHLRTVLVAYAGVFPAEAPVPTLAELAGRWRGWLAPTSPQRTASSPNPATVAASPDVAAAAGPRCTLVAQLTAPGEGGGEVVGMVLTGPDERQAGCGHLSRLHVAPEWWGRGIGRRLHDQALDQLRTAGFTGATLWVLEANRRARSWYERLGWQPTGERQPVYSPAAIDDLGYRLAL